MSYKTLATLPLDTAARVMPRRPVPRFVAARRTEEETESRPNLFADVFSGVIDAPTSPAARARDRARRMVEAAVCRAEAEALPHLTNFWQDEAASQHNLARSANRPDIAPDTAIQALRQALCAPSEVAPDAPATKAERDRLRLAVHAMNTTLTIAYPPVGAMVMTYSFLRGESMRLTARCLVLVAGMTALLNSQIPGI
jgi:hypothetical protein